MSENRQPVIRGPFDGEYVAVVGDRYRYLATTEETEGRYALIEAVVPPGAGPPPHRHSREEEGFYVLEGTVTVYVDGSVVEAAAGSFVNLPKGSKHWFRNHTKQNVKMLVLLSPGGLEAAFREIGQVIGDINDTIPAFDRADQQKLLETAPRYGIEIFADESA